MSDEVEPVIDAAAEPAPRKRGRPSAAERTRALMDAVASGDMATAKVEQEALAEEIVADETAEMLYDITVQRSLDGGPSDVFLGPNGRTVHIRRGSRVTVDAEILEALNLAVETFYEDAPTPENPYHKEPVDRMRFPYILHRSYTRK